MTPITLAIRSEDGKLVETIAGSFDVKDIDILRKFVRAMSRVRNCALLKRGMPAISNISFTAESGLKLTCASYENTELHDLLHVLRPVILQEEATSFQNITGLLRKRFRNRYFSDHLKPIRATFEDGELKAYMQITLGDQPFFDQSTLNLWLNAEQYHTDEEKAARWSEFEQSLNTENVRALVMNQLQGKVKALFHLEYIVGMVLEKSEHVQPPPQAAQ